MFVKYQVMERHVTKVLTNIKERMKRCPDCNGGLLDCLLQCKHPIRTPKQFVLSEATRKANTDRVYASSAFRATSGNRQRKQASLTFSLSIQMKFNCDDNQHTILSLDCPSIFTFPPMIKHLKSCTFDDVTSVLRKKRKVFWDEFFFKYSQKMSHEVEDEDVVTSVSSRVKKKSVSSTQHWVNTGYFPYSTYKKSDMDLKTCSRYKKVSSNLLHRRTTEEKSIKNDEKPRFCENSNTTSVDTMAYILSNMNRTNKVETMAIIEGAKHSISTNSQNVICENTDLIKRTTNEMSRKNCGDPVSNLNNNDQICSFAPSPEKIKHRKQQEKNDLQKTRTALEKNIDISINKILLLDAVKKGKELFHDSKSHSDKQFSESINVNEKSNSDAQNLNTKSLNTEQNCSIEKNPTLQNSSVTVGHRRKLYSGRISPIDLVDMQSSNKNITMFKLSQHLHPAIYIKSEVKKGNKTSVTSRSKNRFSMLNKNSEKNNNSLYTNLSTDVVCLRRLTQNSESTFSNLLLGKPEIEYLSDNSSCSLSSIQICKCDNFDTKLDTSETYDDKDSIKSASIIESRTLHSDESEIVCKNNHGNNVRIDSNQKCFLSDGDDEFTNIVQKYYTNW